MRYEFGLAIVWLLIGACSASTQEKAAQLPQDGFEGEWVGDNEAGVGRILARFVVSKKNNDWSIKAWFNAGAGKEEEMETVPLSLLAESTNNRNTQSRPVGFATWEHKWEKGKGKMTIHALLRLEKGKLVGETIMIHKDLPQGDSYDHEKFKKK